MRSLEEEIGRHLQMATESGEIQSAKSFGKPLHTDDGWNDTPPSLRMPFKILKDAGCFPPEIEMLRQRASLTDMLRNCADEVERCSLQRRLGDLEQNLAFRLEALRISGNV